MAVVQKPPMGGHGAAGPDLTEVPQAGSGFLRGWPGQNLGPGVGDRSSSSRGGNGGSSSLSIFQRGNIKITSYKFTFKVNVRPT